MTQAIQLTFMTVDEARATVDQIKTNLENVRALLSELREREGWRALGYETWQACIQAEFMMSEQRAHQLLNAHVVDRILAPPWQESTAFFGKRATAPPSTGSTIVDPVPIPEAHARALAPLIRQPEALREVHAEVQERTEGKPRAADYREAVDRRLGIERPERESVPPPALSAPPAAPFVMPEREEESEEERAYFILSRQRLLARYAPGAVAATPADPTAALPAWEEFERWFREFMLVLRARASRPIRLAE